jgi:hypothetical protein
MIKLTHFREGHAIYINPTDIVSVTPGQYQHRDGTQVALRDKRWFEVRENPEEIVKMIKDAQ